MSFAAIIPVASLVAANKALEGAGFGPGNFSVPAYTGPAPTHAALHAWTDAAFQAAVAAIAGVVTESSDGDPVSRTKALIEAQGAIWGAQAPTLPDTGNVTAGKYYQFDGDLWYVIQTYSRTTYPAHPSTLPAVITRVRPPGKVEPYSQPLYEFSAYKLVNPFTGKPDECTHDGKDWIVGLTDQAGNNTWTPGEYGWIDKATGQIPDPPVNEWPDFVQPTGAHDSYSFGDKVTFKTKHYTSKMAGTKSNSYSPEAYPAGWQVQA